jgi:hypothetical protein
MEKILSQFEALAQEIAANNQLQLLSFYLAPPAPASEVERFQTQIGVSFPPDLLDYYSLCNGLQLRWIRKDNPAYSVEEFGQFHAGSVPFSDITDDSGRIEGSVYILPISETFGNRGKYYRPTSLHRNKTILLDQQPTEYEKFESQLFPFDFFHPKNNVGILIHGSGTHLAFGTSESAHFFSKTASLSWYLEMLLLSKAYVFGRQDLMYFTLSEGTTKTFNTDNEVTVSPNSMDLLSIHLPTE